MVLITLASFLGDEIVAATIHLDHLGKEDVLQILKVLEPYDDDLKLVTKQELKAGVSLESLDGVLRSPAEVRVKLHTILLLSYENLVTNCLVLIFMS